MDNGRAAGWRSISTSMHMSGRCMMHARTRAASNRPLRNDSSCSKRLLCTSLGGLLMCIVDGVQGSADVRRSKARCNQASPCCSLAVCLIALAQLLHVTHAQPAGVTGAGLSYVYRATLHA